ncbi:hypothetical protein NDU88_006492 [Pleurodeles waltl]|uniref:Uncharacterized protein n=1 Tax=Pleurodeles waltl TaxID=8319 RepID=A0AAV7WDT1_PLEWA|nr:hypothetical protein NDU88_006492 [Pleurodeles waltl]
MPQNTTSTHHIFRKKTELFITKVVILTLAVFDRQGGGPREHRRQAGGAPMGIPTAATVKYATGATAPVAQLPLRRLDSEPASSWKPLSRWAGWRSEGDRPPAQRESQNYRRGLSTAER